MTGFECLGLRLGFAFVFSVEDIFHFRSHLFPALVGWVLVHEWIAGQDRSSVGPQSFGCHQRHQQPKSRYLRWSLNPQIVQCIILYWLTSEIWLISEALLWSVALIALLWAVWAILLLCHCLGTFHCAIYSTAILIMILTILSPWYKKAQIIA